MTLKAVIFDMDGVLVDSEPYWFRARMEFAKAMGTTWDEEGQRVTMGRATIDWARIQRDRMGVSMTPEDLIVEMKRRMVVLYKERLPTLPGAVEAVRIAAQGYKVGLASGSPTDLIDQVMVGTGLDKVFQTIVYGDTVPRGKPNPDIYFEAARRLDVDPADCVGIEDSANGIRALKAAGMVAIAVPSPEYPLASEILSMADHVLPSLESFSLDMVKGLR